jgi:hypothetical protein
MQKKNPFWSTLFWCILIILSQQTFFNGNSCISNWLISPSVSFVLCFHVHIQLSYFFVHVKVLLLQKLPLPWCPCIYHSHLHPIYHANFVYFGWYIMLKNNILPFLFRFWRWHFTTDETFGGTRVLATKFGSSYVFLRFFVCPCNMFDWELYWLMYNTHLFVHVGEKTGQWSNPSERCILPIVLLEITCAANQDLGIQKWWTVR